MTKLPSVRVIITTGICLASLVPRSAFAASIQAATPNINEIAPPASVLEGALESNTEVFVFRERTNFTLPTNLSVDATNVGATILPDGSGGVPGIIPAGTQIESWYLHFDAEGQPAIPEIQPWAITWQNNDQILGIIYSDSRLDGSDFVRNPGTLYPNGEQFRGTTGAAEGDDMINFNLPNEIIAQQSVTVVLDQIRVIFAVPEPATCALGAIMMMGLLATRRRTEIIRA